MSSKNKHCDEVECVETEASSDSYELLIRKRKQFQAVARKIETPGIICAVLLGILGVAAGIGGIVITLRNEMAVGLVITAVGVVLSALAFPVYALISHRRRMDYFERIFFQQK